MGIQVKDLKFEKCSCGCDLTLVQYPDYDMPINYVKGKTIKDMKAGEIIYIQESRTGYSYIFLCEFIVYEGGNVRAKIIGMPLRHEWLHTDYVGKIITAKPCKCLLWGLRTEHKFSDHDFCCHWFKKGVVE